MHSREIITRLERAGWYKVTIVGDHCQFRHPDKPGKVTVPHPVRDVQIKTLRSIERQSGVKLR